MTDSISKSSVMLVTGGCGFIGSAFLRRMVPRHPDVSFVNLDLLTYAGSPLNVEDVADAPNYTFVHGDIADAALVDRTFRDHTPTHVVHFAAESHVDRSIEDPQAFVRTNVLGTATLLDAARHAWKDPASLRSAVASDHPHRFLHVSTDEVFGALEPDDPPFDPSTPYDPRSPYSASKAGSDHLARAYHHTYGLPVVVTNCSNNYGPFQHPEKLIPLVIIRADALESIPVYGKGENVRDWLHVDDHVAGIEQALFQGTPGETYVFGGFGEEKNLAVVQALCDLVDEARDREIGTARECIEFVTDRPGHDFRYAIDPSKATKELGWQPTYTDLKEGLRHTVAWYLENTEWLKAVQDDGYRAYLQRQYGLPEMPPP